MIDRHTSRSRSRSSRPVWPLPSLDGRPPVVVATELKSSGVDLAYARAYSGELLASYPIGAHGSPTHFMPEHLPAFAVADGEVTYAGRHAHSFSMIIDHCNGWASYYTNLGHMFARPTRERSQLRSQRVKAGDVLGYVGATSPDGLVCLHYELWQLGRDRRFVPVEALPHMRSWLLLPWTDERLTPHESALEARAA